MLKNNMNILGDALNAHKDGNTKKAKSLYKKAIKSDSSLAIAHNNLGTILLSEKKITEAISNLRNANRIDPSNVTYIYNLAKALEINLNFHAAAEHYLKSLDLLPNSAKIIIRYIINALRSNQLSKVLTFLSSLGSVNISEILVHSLLVTYSKDDPTNHPILKNSLGAIYTFFNSNNTLDNFSQLQSIRIDNDQDCFCLDLIDRLNGIGFYHSTIDHLLNLIFDAKCDRDLTRITAIRALGYLRTGNFEQSTALFKKAYALDNKNPFISDNLSLSLAYCGKLSEAEHLTNKHNLSNVVRIFKLLNDRQFIMAWKLYNSSSIHSLRKPNLIEFNGDSIKSKSLLIYRDQGIGDEIMFLSCLPSLLNDKPKSITYECSPRLKNLIERSFPEINELIPIDAGSNATDNFCWLHKRKDIDEAMRLSSLPCYYRNSLDAFKKNQIKGYLRPDPELSSLWKNRLSILSNKINIGIAWKGGINFRRGIQQDSLDAFAPLFKYSNVNWVNLQYGDIEFELNYFSEKFGVSLKKWPDINYTNDFDSLSALIHELDLVIQVNNTSLHLAGALGTNAWAILPFGSFDIRWFNGEDEYDCPWYKSVRLFRQYENQSIYDLMNNISVHLKSFLMQYD